MFEPLLWTTANDKGCGYFLLNISIIKFHTIYEGANDECIGAKSFVKLTVRTQSDTFYYHLSPDIDILTSN